MARGWESKAIEAQQDDAGRRRDITMAERAPTAPSTEHATLALARTSALADLQVACAPAHRAMLEEAIRDLDRRLAALTS